MNITSSTPHKPQPVDYISNPFMSCFRGFEKLFKYNQRLSILLLILSGVFGILQVGGEFLDSPSGDQAVSGTAEPVNIGLIVFILCIVLLVVLVFSVFASGIVSFISLKTLRQETTTFKEAFNATSEKFMTIAGVMVLTFLKIMGGTLLFIVPGVRASLRYQMVLLPIFDDDLNARAAMERIKYLTKDHLMEVFGIMTVASLLPVIGTLFQMGGEVTLYPQLKEVKDKGLPKPPTHWLNYLGFVLAGIFFAFMVTLLILLASNFS